MRLTDTDELKAEFDSIANNSAIGEWQFIPIKHIKQIIDNAPTVEITDYDTGYQDGLEDGLNDIRPQGEWEIVDAEGWKIWNCVCTECGHDPQEYIGGTENWWLRKQHLPNFCPNCGVRIVNVKGGAE